jgi:hypothetical protein
VTEPDPADLIRGAWEYPLFEALYGRRSRRFAAGCEIGEGPFQYQSARPRVPLGELEEALLVAAGAGVTGRPLWDMGRPRAAGAGTGRTFGSTTGGRRTALFFTNDDGVYVIDPGGLAAANIREVGGPGERERALDVYRRHRKKLGDGRLPIPRRLPPLFAHNMWDSNTPGSTLFMPYGKFPGTVDAMHLPWFMQVHHLDLAFYDAMFVPGAYGLTHREHMARWHGQEGGS